MSAPSISVVIPAFNAERYIGQAIRSVQRQTVSVAEIIVVDDSSTDRTVEIAEKMNVTVLRKAANTRGIAASRNLGIEAGKGEWIAFLDADDYWDKRKLEFQCEAIKTCPEGGLVACETRLVFSDKGRKPRRLINHKSTNEGVRISRYLTYFPKTEKITLDVSRIHTSAVMLNRRVFSEIEMFNETLWAQEDVDLWLRVLKRFPWVLVRRLLSFHRRHETNTTGVENFLEKTVPPLVEVILRNPENYLPDVGESYACSVKQLFVEKGKRLAAEMKRRRESE